MTAKEKQEIGICFLLFLSGLKLFNLQSAIMCVFFVFSYYYLLKYKSMRIGRVSKGTMTLLFFFLIFTIHYCLNYGYNYSIIRTAVFSILLFDLGNRMIIAVDKPERFFVLSIYSVGIGMAIYASLSFYLNYSGKVLSSMNILDRYVIDYWNGQGIPPTNINTNFLILFATLPFSFFVLKRWEKILPLIFSVLGIGVAFGTATRTNLLMVLISFFLFFLFKIIKRNNEKRKHRATLRDLVFVSIIVVILIALFYMFWKPFFKIVNKLSSSIIYRQNIYVNVNEDPRWRSWREAFLGLFSFPFGNNTDMTMEAHNIVFECGVLTGILPAAILFVFFVRRIKDVLKLFKYSKKNYNCYILGFLTSVICTIAMMIEPVFLGRPFIFIYSCFFWGMISSYIMKR